MSLQRFSWYTSVAMLIAGFWVNESQAEEQNVPKSSPDWKEIAGKARPAVVGLTKAVGEERSSKVHGFVEQNTLSSAGFFISEQGHLICALPAVSGKTRPLIRNVEGEIIPFGSILAIFPGESLALLKLDYEPKVWLPMTEQAVPLNTEVTFVVPSETPPIYTGPVLARRAGRAVTLRKIQFITTLNVGAQPPKPTLPESTRLTGGCPLIDVKGRVVGVFRSTGVEPSQILIEATPVDTIIDRIANAVAVARQIDFPLSPEWNPLDPARNDVAYTNAWNSVDRGQIDEALAHVDILLKEYPGSAMAQLLQLDILKLAGRAEDIRKVIRELSSQDRAVKFEQVELLHQKGLLESESGNFDAAIASFKKLADLSPPDCHVPALLIGDSYRMKAVESGDRNDWLEAAKWYESAISVSPERIFQLEVYQTILDQLGRWEESAALSKRIWELEALYRSR